MEQPELARTRPSGEDSASLQDWKRMRQGLSSYNCLETQWSQQVAF